MLQITTPITIKPNAFVFLEKDIHLPEFKKEEPLKIVAKRIRDAGLKDDLHGRSVEVEKEKDDIILLVPNVEIEYTAGLVPVPAPVRSWEEETSDISKINELNSDNGTSTDIATTFDPVLNFVSSYAGPEISLDIEENVLSSQVLPQSEYKEESYSYCNLSNALITTVEELEGILQ